MQRAKFTKSKVEIMDMQFFKVSFNECELEFVANTCVQDFKGTPYNSVPYIYRQKSCMIGPPYFLLVKKLLSP